MDFSGKTFVVTGASSGIGRNTARALVENGARVHGVARRVGELPEGVVGHQIDLTRSQEVEGFFAGLEPLDGFVNNAGLARQARILDGDPAEWRAMWEINVHALSLCAQKAVPLLKERAGILLNVSSMSGHRVPSSGGFYAATKFAVRAVTEALRHELRGEKSAVRVASISPGFVETPLLELYFANKPEALEKTKSSMRMLQPEDVAAAILHTLRQPPHVEIGDILLRSVDQS